MRVHEALRPDRERKKPTCRRVRNTSRDIPGRHVGASRMRKESGSAELGVVLIGGCDAGPPG